MRAFFALLFGLVLAREAGADPALFAWPHGRHAAIALTYDDALRSQLNVAIPQLDAAGLKGTFFLEGEFAQEDLPRWRAAAAAGHELGNHSIFHPCARGTFKMPPQYNSENYSAKTMLNEIRVMNTFLFAIDGRATRGYATPCGQTKVGGKDYIEALRASGLVHYVRGVDHAPTVLDPRRINTFDVPTQFFDEGVTGAQLIAFIEKVRRSGGFGVMGFHGVGGDYLTTSAEAHQALVHYLEANQGDIWIAPLGELLDYVAAHREDPVR
jgi:peptidoglycan-N-acetylglucosamine deacetylase